MLITLILWIYISFLSIVWGLIFIDIIKRLFNLKEESAVSLPVLCFIGLGMMSLIALFLSIFISIGLAAHCAVVLPAVITIFIRRRFVLDEIKKQFLIFKNYNALTIIMIAFFALILLLETSLFYPGSFDTALYHAQAIRWIEHYPAVPGLGNFNMQMGYNSAWFISQALFSFSFIPGMSFHILNGLCFFWTVVFFLDGMDLFFKGKISFSGILKALLLPVSFYLYASLSSSPSTDMPAALLTWILFLLFLDNASNEKVFGSGMTGFAAVFLTAYLIIIKLSGLPLVLLFFYVLIRQYKAGNKKAAFFSAGVFLLFLLPWLARNVIQTGYLIYPFEKIDLFSFDWKVPPAAVQYDAQWIGFWAFKKPAGMGLIKYITDWFGRLPLENKILFYPLMILGGLSLIITICQLFRKRLMPGRMNWNSAALIVLAVDMTSVIFLFLTAPAFRFGAGVLVFICIFFIAGALRHAGMRFGRYIAPAVKSAAVVLIPLLLLIEVFSVLRYFPRTDAAYFYIEDKPANLLNRFILPAPYPENDKNKMVSFKFPSNMTLYVPKIGDGAYSWYDPFPSSAYYYQDIQLRGASLREGFRRPLR